MKNYWKWMNKRNPLGFFLSQVPGTSAVLTVIKRIVVAVNFLITMDYSDNILAITLKVSSQETSVLKWSSIGAKTKKKLKKYSSNSVNRTTI